MNKYNGNNLKILIAEDDSDDRLLAKEVFSEFRLTDNLVFVEDGVEVIDYLGNCDPGSHIWETWLPDLILLDLNMPRKSGREVLAEIKNKKEWRQIPVVVLTTSNSEDDIYQSYALGAAGFISKPASFEEYIKDIQGLLEYWFEIVRLPKKDHIQ